MKNRNLDAWIEFMDITMQRLLNLSLLELELISINFYAKCHRKSIFGLVKIFSLVKIISSLVKIISSLVSHFDRQRTNTYTFL